VNAVVVPAAVMTPISTMAGASVAVADENVTFALIRASVSAADPITTTTDFAVAAVSATPVVFVAPVPDRTVYVRSALVAMPYLVAARITA
jgi:hypothetical protein